MAGAHAQSVLGALLRSRPNLHLTRRLLATDDGGQIAVDTDADAVRHASESQEEEQDVLLTTWCRACLPGRRYC